MSSATSDALERFDSYELDVRARELRRGTERIRLQAQPFEILTLMLERRGDVVSREELTRRLWPEGTFVDFEHSLNAAVKRLRAALGDDAAHPRFVETIPRRGYRFIASFAASDGDREPDCRARVAVLPFTESSGDCSDDGFSRGLTDETILQLGRLDHRTIDVIARSSSSTFTSGACLARDIGATLRADYLLEGAVRCQRDRMRITAWLVETAGETQLWTDVYDRCVTDALSLQAEIASCIASSVASVIDL